MNKISMPISNDFCPQTLFLYGTYKEDGTPNFGLFCWFTYYCDTQLGAVACIGGDKLTKDRILETKTFSANLVTEQMLPLADYLGNIAGYEKDKMNFHLETEEGKVLNVPILSCSPIAFELRVSTSIPCDGGEVFLCKICNVLADEDLVDTNKTIEERLQSIAPICTTCTTYFSWAGKSLGKWGKPSADFNPANLNL